MMDHPNIISLYDSFEENGVLMIEMEYADGGSVHIYHIVGRFGGRMFGEFTFLKRLANE